MGFNSGFKGLTAHGQCDDVEPQRGTVTWEGVKEGDLRSDKDKV